MMGPGLPVRERVLHGLFGVGGGAQQVSKRSVAVLSTRTT